MGLEGLRGANLGCPLVHPFCLLCALPGLGSFKPQVCIWGSGTVSFGPGDNNYQPINTKNF